MQNKCGKRSIAFNIAIILSAAIFLGLGKISFIHAETPENLLKNIPGQITVEGTIVERSLLPDPKQSDYPDCRYTAHFKGHAIVSGDMCQRDLNLVIEGFKDYKNVPSQAIKTNDLVKCTIVPFENLPDELKSTQQADDLNLFQLDSYYVISIQKITNFSMSESLFSDGLQSYVSVFERHINPPIPDNLVKLQQKQIAEDLKKVNALLEGYPENITELNRKFKEQWEKEKAKDPPGYNRVNDGTIVWRNVDNSFWCLPEKYNLISEYKYRSQNIEALVALRDFLHANGIQFIVSVVPNLYDISARVMNPEFRNVPDFRTALIVQALLKNGVEAIYPSEEILKNFNRYLWTYFYPINQHPSDTCQDVISDIIAKRLNRFNFTQNMESRRFSFAMVPHMFKNNPEFFFPLSCDIGNNKPNTSYCVRCVLYNGKRLESDPSSPILLIGNSYLQTPVGFPASFPTLLASKLCMGVSTYAVRGYGPMLSIIKNFANSPELLLKGKKVLIMYVGTTHLDSFVRFNNIQEIDQVAQMISNKKVRFSVPVEGNTTKEFDFAKALQDANLFIIPTDRTCLVKEFVIQNCDSDKEKIMVIQVCTSTKNIVDFRINGKTISFEKCYGYFSWCKTVIRIPAEEKSIRVELIGRPDAAVAIRNIQIYQ